MPDTALPITSDVAWNQQSQGDAIVANETQIDLENNKDFKHEDQTSLLLPPSDAINDDSSDDDDSSYDPDEDCPQSPTYCTGCSLTRILMSPMVLLVLGLVGITYYAYVYQIANVTIAELVLFHFFIAMLLVSYFQCMLLDPGTVPDRWHNAIRRLPFRVHFKVGYRHEHGKPTRAPAQKNYSGSPTARRFLYLACQSAHSAAPVYPRGAFRGR